MSAFYARYVPPASGTNSGQTQALTEQTHSQISGHRADSQRRVSEGKYKGKRSKTQEVERPTDDNVIPKRLSSDLRTRPDIDKEGQAILKKYRVTGFSGASLATVRDHRGGSEYTGNNRASGPDSEVSALPEGNKRKRKRQALRTERDANGDKVDLGPSTEDDGKHAAVLSRFQEATARARQSSPPRKEHNQLPLILQEEKELHGLEPIPQPEEAPKSTELPSYSVLPPWLESPQEVPSDVSVPFSSLALSDSALSNLKTHNLSNAFPIQSALIPLLLGGERRYEGDICVSAATGSGKTLAYVLPIFEDLKLYAATKLRAVIVVPTRELVSQVRSVCELCVMGTNVKVATVVGSKSLKEEADMLVRLDEVYDPVQYSKEKQEPVDWADLTLDKLFDHARGASYPENRNYVTRYSSKVDILICTPGRLVDHMRSTAGLHLDDVTWFVIDEADRLLNESYQEWVDIVMPALQSRKATKMRDEILLRMRLDLPIRDCRKIALSATMTRDISKLNSLDLCNPKLIVLGKPSSTESSEVKETGRDEMTKENEDGAFRLPEHLVELAVGVSDGAEKPLYLLEVLRVYTSILKTNSIASQNGQSKHDGSVTSDSDSTSSSDESSSDEACHISASGSSKTAFIRADKGQSNFARSPARNEPERALIFTRSSESALRLSRLLTLLEPSLAPKISSLSRTSTTSASTRRAVQSFRQGKTTVLIATDRASRGLDVPGLEHIISYDVPNSVNTYVHRVGRTARAGMRGSAYTLVAHREGRWFWKNIGRNSNIDSDKEASIDRGARKVKRIDFDLALGEDSRERYEEALKTLGEEVRAT